MFAKKLTYTRGHQTAKTGIIPGYPQHSLLRIREEGLGSRVREPGRTVGATEEGLEPREEGLENPQCLPSPSAPLRPHLFTLENDHTFRQLSSSKFKGALEEYQLLVCYGFFLSCTVQAENELAEALRAHGHEDFARQAETCLNSAAAVEQAVRQRVHYIRLAKGQSKLSPSDQMFAEHLRTAFQPSTTHLGCPNTAALHEYFKSKELECSLAAAAKAAAGKKYISTSAPAPSITGKSAFQKDKNFKHKSKKGKEAESADEA